MRKLLISVASMLMLISLTFMVACGEKPTIKTYNVTIAETEHGTVTADATVEEGKDLTITATPDTNYELDALVVNGATVQTTDNVFVLKSVSSDVTVSATFVPAAYKVTFDYGAGSGEEAYRMVKKKTAVGALPAVEAPANGAFAAFYCDGKEVTADYIVTSDVTFTARFITATVTLAQTSANTAVGGLGEKNVYVTFDISVMKGDEPLASNAYDVTVSNSQIATYEDGKLSALADGTVQLIVSYNGKELARSEEITCVSYAGYTAVSDKDGFLAIANAKDGKYYLTRNIDLEGVPLWNPTDFTAIFGTFTGVLDGFGYRVSNAIAHPSGWGQGAFAVMSGIVRNIAFTDMRTEERSAANNGFFGRVENGLVENVYLDLEYRNTGRVDNNSSYGALVADVSENAVIRNCVVNLRATQSTADIGAIAYNAANWTGKVENVFTMTNGNPVTANFGGLYFKEAAEGVADYITTNSGVFLYTYTLINSDTVDIGKLPASVWSVKDGAVYFHDLLALAKTPEYVLEYTGGDISKVFESDPPAKELLNLNVLHNTQKMDEIPQDLLVFASTNENVAVVGIDESGNIFIDYKGEGTTTITVTVKDSDPSASVSFNISLIKKTIIANVEDFRTKITANLNGDFLITADLDFAGGFLSVDGTDFGMFTGRIDGGNHKLSNFWLGNGWRGGMFFTMKGTMENIAFVNVNGSALPANVANGLFGSIEGDAVIRNVYIDYVVNANGSPIGDDRNFIAQGPLAGCSFGCTVENVVINLRFGADFNAGNIDRVGAIVGSANAWASNFSNIKVLVNADVTLKLAYADVTGDGIRDMWANNNCTIHRTLADLAASNLSTFSGWTITGSTVMLGDTVLIG